MNKTIGIIAPALALGISMGILTGQSNAQSANSITTKESVIRHLSKDIFIFPGAGFRKVQIGHEFERVARTWGAPNKKKRTLSSQTWIYTIGSTTQIEVSGGQLVKRIEVRGSFNSPFESSEGARFGMSPHQIISIYGPPPKGDLTRMRYPAKGIELEFKNAGLFSIRVFAKKN